MGNRSGNDDHSSPIDHATFEKWQALGGEEFMQTMAIQFVKDARNCGEAIQEALDTNPPEGLREAAHGLKGMCANVGATAMKDWALHIEQASREGTPVDASQTMESLHVAMADILAYLGTIHSAHS